MDSCNARYACYYAAAYGGADGGEILTIDNSCNSDFACYLAAGARRLSQAAYNAGDITSGIIGCCNTGNATFKSEGICYKANETTLFTQDPTCSSAPVSVSATADSVTDYLINKDEIALGDFLIDLAHELYNLVKELAKNKKD